MNIDTEGRVVRVETMSKCVAPGMRLGWLAAPQSTLAVLRGALVSSTMGPSGHASLAATALTQAWGQTGFDTHVRQLQARTPICLLRPSVFHG